ncbi:MAG: hypothetical protein H0T42_24375 [Deltaproteobacteria bacterium]|nr:hypothetical protein [Deltaproteobacteria bacterium]
MSGRRLTLVVLAGLTVIPSMRALAQSPTDDVDAEGGAVDEGDPAQATKDPKLAKKLAAAAQQLAQKGDYSTRRNKLDEAKGFYEQAANAYGKAIEIGDDPNLYFDLATVEEKLGKLDLAVRHLARVIGAKSSVKPDVQKKAQLKYDDLSMQVGLVTLQVDPDVTSVSVAGEVLGTSPFNEPLVFMPGAYKLSFASDGYQPKDLDIKVEAGSEAERKISLEPIKIVVSPPREPGSEDETETPGVASPPSKLPLYVGGGVTVVAFGAFIVSGILAVGEHGTFVGADSTRAEREDARASGQSYALFSDIMLGTTLVAAGFTTYWYMFKYRKGNAKATETSSAGRAATTMSKVDIVPWVQPSASGLSVAGTF